MKEKTFDEIFIENARKPSSPNDVVINSDELDDMFGLKRVAINDGIEYALWEAKAGEIVTLNRDESRWVYEKLKELEELKEVIRKSQEAFEKIEVKHKVKKIL